MNIKLLPGAFPFWTSLLHLNRYIYDLKQIYFRHRISKFFKY